MATLTDDLGNALSGASQASRDHYAQALRDLQRYVGDPVAAADRAIAESPGFVMAHALHGWLHLLGTEPSGLQVARRSLGTARALPATAEERGHLAAIGHLVDGEWLAASRVLEDLTVAWPRDALALQVGHQIDFFTGNARMLRDRIARALPAWSPGMPGHHALLSMYAFGLEETGDYARAEAVGREAVAAEPRDGWGQHAVAHVLEMQNRTAEGVAWMRSSPETWSTDSFFAVHNWWHLALYHLDRGEVSEVLSLYDGPVKGGQSALVLDLLDATALLWRLHLLGIEVGDHWIALADMWDTVGGAGGYAFNDWHAAMAHVGAGRDGAAEAVREATLRAAMGTGDNAMFSRDVGLPLISAVQAFGRGDYAAAVASIRPVREVAHRFGGSHAQRDLIDLTLIEAAIRSGDAPLADALTAERAAIRPHSPIALNMVRKAKLLPLVAA
jgi:hypothetical protein